MARDYLSNIEGLIDYQVDHTETLLNALRNHRAALDGSEMGTGKTFSACAVVRELDVPTLVVCPKSSITKWERTGQFMGGEVSAINYEMLGTGRTPFGKWWRDRGNMRFKFADEAQLIIFDECHRCGGMGTGNCKMMIGAKQEGKMILGLSATPAEHPGRMMALGYALGLYESPKESALVMGPKGIRRVSIQSRAVSEPFLKWAKGYKFFRPFFGGILDFYGDRSDMERLNSLIFPERGSRIRIDDLGDAFPETRITTELRDLLSGRSLDIAREIMAEPLASLAEMAATDDPDCELLAGLREHQEVELLKLPALVEIMKEAIAAGRSPVAFVNFRQTAVELHRMLREDEDIAAGLIIGAQRERDRQDSLENFMQDCYRALVCTNAAAGESLDMQDVRGEFPRSTYIFPPWAAWLLRQILGRVRRAGAKSKSQQYILGAAGTKDEDILEKIDRKLDNLDALLDGDLTYNET